MATKNPTKSVSSLSRIFAVLTISIGLLSVVGWIFDLPYLKAVIPQLIAIKFNTALSILLLGVTAYSFSKSIEKQNRLVNYLITSVVFVIAFMTFLQYLSYADFGIDELLIKDTEPSYLKPGRMSFISSVVLTLTSISIFLSSKKKLLTSANTIQLLNLFISVLALLGYLYGASGLLSFLPYKTIAPQTVIAFTCLNLSLLFSNGDSVILRPFLSTKSGGVLGRKLLPVTLLTLIGIGFFVRKITQNFNIDASIDGAVVVALSLFLFSFFIWWNAHQLNSLDIKLQEKNKALEQLNSELEVRVQERTNELQRSEQKFRETVELAADGIFEADLNGVYTSVNISGCRMLGYEEHEIIGKTIMDIIPSEDIPKLKNVLAQHSASSEVIQLEWNLRRKDGSLLPVEISSRTVKNHRIVAFVRDVTLRKQSELALIASEKKFRTVFEGAYDAILVADKDGRITMINEQLGKKFGYLRDELIGQPIEVLIPERFRASHVVHRNEYAEHAHSRPMGAGLDLYGRKKDGTEFPVDISLSPVFSDEGLRVTAIIRDITERKKFEEQQKFLAEMGRVLEETFDYDEKIEKLVELLVEKIADTCVIKVIKQGELVYKASATKQKQYSEEFKKIAKTIVIPGGFGSIHVLQTGQPVIIEDVQKEITDNPDVDESTKKFISDFGVFSYAVFPLKSQGRPVGTLALFIRSEGKKLSKDDANFFRIVSSRCAVALENARLHKYSHLAEVVANNLPSMIAYWDKDQVCQFANKSYVDWFGVTPENLLGKSMQDLLGTELYHKNKPYIDGALAGQTQQFERVLTMKSTGEVRHTHALYVPDVIHGEVAGFFVLVVDVSDIKKAELEALSQKDRAERAVQTREEILAIVSHDLKNPLAAVSLSADILTQEKTLPWNSVRESGFRIQRSVKQMQLLISDLLDFAKMQSSTFSVDLSVEQPKNIITQVVDSFKVLAQQKDITIRLDLPKHLKNIACDGGRIVQVLSNLIGNSLKFSSKGSQVIVSARDEKKALLISVSDTGPGIPPEQLSKVFDRFWQAEKAKKLGSGLGLSIAQGIIQAHNGKIWVESEVGKGTTFFFTLPYATAAHSSVNQEVEEESVFNSPEILTGVRILLVDDSEDNIAFVKLILEQVGAEVSIASSAREALKAIQKNHFDLVITDIEMPDVSGYQLLTEVRRAIGNRLPVMSFSAHSTGVQYEKIKSAGFDGNIFKPIKPKVLVGEISRVLENSF